MKIKTHPKLALKRLDPVQISYSPYGKLRMSRWKPGMNPQWANGTVMQDIPPGSEVTLIPVGKQVYEVRI